jgi:phage-related protein
MAVQLTFGSYAFGSSVERYAVTQKPRTKQIVVPRRDGVRMDIPPLGPLEIRLSGRLIDTTQAGLRSQFDSLKAALLKKRDRLTLFDDRFVDALLVSYGDDFVPGAGMLAARYDLTFVGELPFLQSVTLNSNSQTVSVSPTTWNVTAAGNTRTRPVIRITNTSGGSIVNNIKVENLTLGKALVFTGALAAGRTLVLDMQARTITNDNVEDLTNWQGEFWELAVGANSLKYTGGVSVTIVTEWRDRWV